MFLDPADQTYYWDDLELVNEIIVTNDLCGDAFAIDCGATYTGDTSDFFNIGAPEEACGTALNTAPGAWHTLTIPADGDYNVTVDTFGSAFDTKLGVFSGTCDALVCVDGNDDTDGVQSEVSFVGTASETYILYVTGFGTNAGVYVLNVACETVLDVTQNDLVDIAMYPNPATSVVTLDASQEIATIQIMNLLGQTVSTIEVNNTSSTVNVSQLRTGVYIANVLFSNGEYQTMKFVKE